MFSGSVCSECLKCTQAILYICPCCLFGMEHAFMGFCQLPSIELAWNKGEIFTRQGHVLSTERRCWTNAHSQWLLRAWKSTTNSALSLTNKISNHSCGLLIKRADIYLITCTRDLTCFCWATRTWKSRGASNIRYCGCASKLCTRAFGK